MIDSLVMKGLHDSEKDLNKLIIVNEKERFVDIQPSNIIVNNDIVETSLVMLECSTLSVGYSFRAVELDGNASIYIGAEFETIIEVAPAVNVESINLDDYTGSALYLYIAPTADNLTIDFRQSAGGSKFYFQDGVLPESLCNSGEVDLFYIERLGDGWLVVIKGGFRSGS